MRTRWRVTTAVIGVAAALSGVALAAMLGNARADPVLRRLRVEVAGWPAGTPPVRVLLWSDIHLGNAATDRSRLMRLVALADALRPDLVLLAGDFIAGHEPRDAAVAPDLAALRGLRAPLGVVAVLGNHDHWTDARAVRRALTRAGAVVLANEVVVRGPLAIAGLDDAPTRHARRGRLLDALARTPGLPLLVTHSPEVPGGWRRLVVAGHTHCGQIVLPLIGAPVEVTAPFYRCGVVREPGRTTIVTAGTGTSVLPLRFGAPPDWWLLTISPPRP